MLMGVLATGSELWVGVAGAFVEHHHLFFQVDVFFFNTVYTYPVLNQMIWPPTTYSTQKRQNYINSL